MKERTATREQTNWVELGGGVVFALVGLDTLITARTLSGIAAGAGIFAAGLWFIKGSRK